MKPVPGLKLEDIDTRELVIVGTPNMAIRNAVAGLPHKRPSLAIRLLHQSELILDDCDRMRGVAPSGYLLAFGYLLGGRSQDDTDAGQFRNISRFCQFYSRFGLREFPISAATGIRLQVLESPRRFCDRNVLAARKSKNFPLEREKQGSSLRPTRRPSRHADDNVDVHCWREEASSGAVSPLRAWG